LSFYEGVGVLKIEELESELLCTDSTALKEGTKMFQPNLSIFANNAALKPIIISRPNGVRLLEF
jgi:hypothetical protein